MHCVRKITDDLYWVGGDDHHISLFENIHPLENGVSYNSYLLLDDKTVLFDTVDWAIGRQFIENIQNLLAGRSLDYIVINHMEPDHSATIEEIILRYPNVKIISNEKAFVLMKQFGFHVEERSDKVCDGDTRSFGKHQITFISAPMVHWPETMATLDTTNGVLFSADAFGSFGCLNGKLFNDEVNFECDWLEDARRYYSNIVGKFGLPVQSLLKKISKFDVKMICPLHGLVWRNNLDFFINKYKLWSSYEPESNGVLIAYASMYGDTECAASVLASKLCEKGFTDVTMYDVSKTHVSKLISETFRVGHIVLASVTYNMGIFPPMQHYLEDMKALNVQNRTFAIIENGSWACRSGTLMQDILDSMKNITILESKATLCSAMTENSVLEIDALADTIIKSIKS